MLPDQREAWIIQQVERFAQEQLQGNPKVFDDTTNFMYIDRGHIIALDDGFFLVRGNEKEGRFGLDEQPKFWVKRALCLNTGRKQILKLMCHEAFKVNIGLTQVTCVRSGEKEARVLEFVRGDSRFMQGRTVRDTRGNLVRVIDYIEGMDLLNYIYTLKASHEEYFRAHFPSILARTVTAFQAIQFLNENGMCHGDIRNDHIIVERETARFRWIDFDLTQDFSDFDLWSLGNILHCVVGKGFVNFREAIDERPELSGRLTGDDASAFFPQRVMNLRMIYPYVPKKLNDVLLRFSAGTQTYYDSARQVADDLCECSYAMGWPVDQE